MPKHKLSPLGLWLFWIYLYEYYYLILRRKKKRNKNQTGWGASPAWKTLMADVRSRFSCQSLISTEFSPCSHRSTFYQTTVDHEAVPFCFMTCVTSRTRLCTAVMFRTLFSILLRAGAVKQGTCEGGMVSLQRQGPGSLLRLRNETCYTCGWTSSQVHSQECEGDQNKKEAVFGPWMSLKACEERLQLREALHQ